jgi:hypothetical protein
MALNIDWMWLIIGIVLGMFVVPTVLKTVKGKTSKAGS